MERGEIEAVVEQIEASQHKLAADVEQQERMGVENELMEHERRVAEEEQRRAAAKEEQRRAVGAAEEQHRDRRKWLNRDVLQRKKRRYHVQLQKKNVKMPHKPKNTVGGWRNPFMNSSSLAEICRDRLSMAALRFSVYFVWIGQLLREVWHIIVETPILLLQTCGIRQLRRFCQGVNFLLFRSLDPAVLIFENSGFVLKLDDFLQVVRSFIL